MSPLLPQSLITAEWEGASEVPRKTLLMIPVRCSHSVSLLSVRGWGDSSTIEMEAPQKRELTFSFLILTFDSQTYDFSFALYKLFPASRKRKTPDGRS